jgi:hypothetical protein
MTSTSIYTPIKPTYLYIKQHSITGLKYFGKTTYDNPYKYTGSGLYWKKHIKKHGKQFITTLWVSDLYYDTSIVEHALHFSYENNIAKSDNWANLIPENGIDGGSILCSEKTKIKLSIANIGKTLTEEHKANMSAANKGKPKSEKTKANMSIAQTGLYRTKEHKINISSALTGKSQKIVTCPRCSKTGGVNNMKRYHFTNCKIVTVP